MASEKANEKGVVIEVLPNAEMRVELEGGKIVRCYTSGRMRLRHIHVAIGDKVEVFMPPIGAIGRVVYRE
jgi:translation initiation factor IF-1